MNGELVVEVARRGKLLVGEPDCPPGVPVVLGKRGSGEARPGDLALVRTGRGRARLERVLGRADRIETVLEALLVQEGELAGFEPYDPPPFSTEGRVDLRGELAFTIDPETAKDFDDALTLHDDRVLVHIADVSWFVPAGSPLDHGAGRRAFSVYVPGLVAPMLPPELADDLCSLRPDVERLCMTVEFPPGGEPNFYRSVIRSNARLTYGQAQRREVPADVAAEVELAAAYSDGLRHRRFARGALRIERPEIEFEFDGEGGVASASWQAEPDSHALVEELMIL